VFLDGVDITEIEPAGLRANITAVFQDFGKYYLTIEDNITLGENKEDKNRMEHAAAKAGLADKIQTFKGGYKTHLGRTFKNGEQLSGGQWQKIALARGFFKNGHTLILDEPTSSMDPVAEHEFFRTLKNEMAGRIVILITHRLYNLKIADQIYVMENGSIAEGGTFTELMARNGAFKKMYDKQGI
jgi:ATP-binding cassette subfamily B protein